MAAVDQNPDLPKAVKDAFRTLGQEVLLVRAKEKNSSPYLTEDEVRHLASNVPNPDQGKGGKRSASEALGSSGVESAYRMVDSSSQGSIAAGSRDRVGSPDSLVSGMSSMSVGSKNSSRWANRRAKRDSGVATSMVASDASWTFDAHSEGSGAVSKAASQGIPMQVPSRPATSAGSSGSQELPSVSRAGVASCAERFKIEFDPAKAGVTEWMDKTKPKPSVIAWSVYDEDCLQKVVDMEEDFPHLVPNGRFIDGGTRVARDRSRNTYLFVKSFASYKKIVGRLEDQGFATFAEKCYKDLEFLSRLNTGTDQDKSKMDETLVPLVCVRPPWYPPNTFLYSDEPMDLYQLALDQQMLILKVLGAEKTKKLSISLKDAADALKTQSEKREARKEKGPEEKISVPNSSVPL